MNDDMPDLGSCCICETTGPLVRSLRVLAREIVREQVQLVGLLRKKGERSPDDFAIMRDHFVHIYQASLEAMRQIDDPTLVEGKER